MQLLAPFFDNNEDLETLEMLYDENESKEIFSKTIKQNVTILFDTFGQFTDNYPDNQTYSENREYENESVQS